MGLDLWFRADVARILQATHEAMSSTAAVMGEPIAEGSRDDDLGGRERAAGYRQGFGAALRAVATAFGLTEPGAVADRWRVVVPPDLSPDPTSAYRTADRSPRLPAHGAAGPDLPWLTADTCTYAASAGAADS
jgi:hypothetical protein